MNRNVFRLLIDCIKNSASLIIGAVVSLAVCLLVFYLYDLPTEAVIYAFMLVAAIMVSVMLVAFYKKLKAYNTLCAICKGIEQGYCEQLEAELLPQSLSAVEDKYTELVTLLSELLQKHSNDKIKSETEAREYFTMWVHQIKTPITVMRLILEKDTSEKAKTLCTELFKIEQYAGMALSFARLETSQKDYVFAKYDIENIMRQAVRKLATLFVAKRLSLDYSKLSISAVTDEKWLMFCLEQILANAVKYTNEGKISIYSDSIYDENGGKMGDALVIADTGIGIAKEDIPKIFDMGYTGYNGRMFERSTGVGLYLTKKALDGLGHGIEVHSSIGKGTEVRIIFRDRTTLYE